MNLIIALFAVGFAVIGTTKLLFPKLCSDLGFSAFPSRMLLGIALVVCLMNNALYFFPGKSAAFVVFSLMWFFVFIAWHQGKLFKTCSRIERQSLSVFYVLTLILIVWRLWSAARIGELVPLEGTGNHDEFWYISIAEWLYNHNLQHDFSTNELYPLAASAATNIGLLPRVGSESLITFISGLSGASIEQSFAAVFVIGAVLMVYAVALELAADEGYSFKEFYLATLIAVMSPVFLFVYGNMNLATAFGIAFLGGYYYFIQRSFAIRQNYTNYVAAGIFLAAIFATYSELAAVAVPATIVVAVQKSLKRTPGGFIHTLRTSLIVVLVAIVSAPMAAVNSYKVLKASGSAVLGDNVVYPDLFSSLTPLSFPLTVFTFDSKYVMSAFGEIGVALSSFALVVVVAFAPKPLWSRLFGLIVGCLFVLFVFWFNNYGYGGMKAIQFFALPLATLLSAGVVRLMFVNYDGRRISVGSFNMSPPETKSRLNFSYLFAYLHKNIVSSTTGFKVGCFVGYALAFLALGIWGYVTVAYSISFDKFAQSNHFNKSLIDLERARSVFKPGDVLYISDDLGESLFMSSRWIAYIFKKTQLIYAPALHGGGYLYNLDNGYENKKANITHILQKRSEANTFTPGSVFANENYEILSASQVPVVVIGSGFSGDEGGKRWMDQKSEVTVFGRCAKKLRIVVLERFSGSTGESAIEVSSLGGPKIRFNFPEGNGYITYPLQNSDFQVVELTSLAAAKSPKELGMSLDSRPLTFLIGKIEIVKIENC